MQYFEHIYTKKFIAYLKFKSNWAFCIFSGNPTDVSPKTEQRRNLYKKSVTPGPQRWLLCSKTHGPLVPGKTEGEERIYQSWLATWYIRIIYLVCPFLLNQGGRRHFPWWCKMGWEAGVEAEVTVKKWRSATAALLRQQVLPRGLPPALPCKHILSPHGRVAASVVQWAPWKAIIMH